MRPRPGRRGAAGDGGLSVPAGPAALAALRPALERAVAVARAGERAKPPLPAPRGLSRVMRFKQLRAPALLDVMAVLERDDAFRARVADASSETEAGRAGWLFLTRPPGWEEELADLVARAEGGAGDDGGTAEPAGSAASHATSDRDERAARTRARKAEEQRRRLETERDRARAGLTAEKERAASLARDLREHQRAGEALRRDLDTSRTELAAVRERLARAEAELVEAAAAAARREEDPGVTGPLEEATTLASALQSALDEAVEAARGIGAALDAIRTAAGATGESREQAVGTRGGTSGGRSGGPARSAARGASRRSVARRPSSLPPGLRTDTDEGARHLMARGTILLVDGYNASMWLWPRLAGAEQRTRLTDALTELAARTGTEPWVVFDGSEEGAPAAAGGQPARPARSPVKVRFSAPGVEADDVILELVEQLPASRPLVVASDDRRVRAGAERGGAHVIGVGQLARLIGR